MQEGFNQGAAGIIIPVHNRYDCSRTLLESIYRYTDHPFHLYVIDNASTDETMDLHKIYSRDITIVHNRQNRGWSGGINQGLKLASNPYVVFMNPDIEISQDWLGNMIAFLNTHPRIAAVGPLHSGTDDWQCVDCARERIVTEIPHFFTEDLHERNRILRYHFHRTGILVDGALAFSCVVLKRRAVDDVGLLADSGASDNEADYCRRLRRAGYVLGLALDTYVVRHAKRAAESRRSKAGRRHSHVHGVRS